jgi:hypothetical protein
MAVTGDGTVAVHEALKQRQPLLGRSEKIATRNVLPIQDAESAKPPLKPERSQRQHVTSRLPGAELIASGEELAGDELCIAGQEVIGAEGNEDDAIALTAVAEPYAEEVGVDRELLLGQAQRPGHRDRVPVAAIGFAEGGSDLIGVADRTPSRPVQRVAFRPLAAAAISGSISAAVALALASGDGHPLVFSACDDLKVIVETQPPGPLRHVVVDVGDLTWLPALVEDGRAHDDLAQRPQPIGCRDRCVHGE